KASFEVTGWDEKPYNEMEGELKLTRASVTRTYTGEIQGEAAVEYLMMYREDGSASFLGLERVVGSLGGRSGSFVLQHNGTFEGGVAKYSFSVVPGSGTRDLHGLRAEGEFASRHQQHYTLTLNYDFE
ncbi:DUF3224 domain-containing protein, partial [bacterium]|nr:DUF3224 domain-containing protein [bacterium]